MKSTITFLFLFISFVSHSQSWEGKTLSWNFPLNRTHTGILLGNGTQGLMVWGKDNQLKITIGRAGFWDHRGGNEFSARTTYKEVKKLLEAKDEVGLRKTFEVPKKSENQPSHPQQMGGGTLILTFPESYTLASGKLQLYTADIKIIIVDPFGNQKEVVISQDPMTELAWVDVPKEFATNTKIEIKAAWENSEVRNQMEKVGIVAPSYWNEKSAHGFTQSLPDDLPLSIGYKVLQNRIYLKSQLGGDINTLKRSIDKITSVPSELKNTWWKNYWAEVPKITIPDPVLQEIVDYGLYKQACTTPPQGIPSALQGPFMEEYQLPPWSNDYHFNINIQMIYTPALASNRAAHLNPLWSMMKAWMPQLKSNGEKFFGIPGALMLPHAVDDRCHVVGTFWTGTIDHACTAWMGYLAWQHYAYTMDENILKDMAYPLLVGAFEGYWAMLEQVNDGKGGKRFTLPVSVSPEFRGDAMNAWGRDASFQLAALHKVASILPTAAEKLNKQIDPRWNEVSKRLPPYTTFEGSWIDEWPSSKSKRIALWEGQDLIESHRHHSHLGSIYPFVTINPQAEEHKDIINASINRWVNRGMGMWSGWCVPWASTLFARTGNSEAAVSTLHYWNENFVNEGKGTLHNSNKPGASIFSHPVFDKLPEGSRNSEIMQLDAGFGALSAVFELLVQNREDGIHVLPKLHYQWKELSFENIRTEGAFQVSAKVSKGKVSEIKVKSLAGGKLSLIHGLGENYVLNGRRSSGAKLERDCTVGEVITLTRIN
jgi:alpha-L-fucosidase 2